MHKRTLPAEVNVSSTPYLRLIAKCLSIFLGLLVLAYALSVSSVYFVSLERERDWFSDSYTDDVITADNTDPLARYIRMMVSDIDPDMVDYVHVQCDDGDFDNAMATLGGQVFIGKTLIEDIESENELFFVLAHEIGHVQHRHVIRNVAFRIPFVLAQVFLGQDVPVNSTAQLMQMDFSRKHETQADQFAHDRLMHRYGHVGGVDRFFERTQMTLDGWQDYLGSHPSHGKRLDSLSVLPDGETTLFRKNIVQKSCRISE